MLENLFDYIQDLNPETPKSAIALASYISISEILCFNRVVIDLPLGKVIPNLYGITFMDSGTGKDKIVREIKEVLPFFKQKDITCETIYNNQKEEVELHLATLGTKSEKARYKETHEPRLIHTSCNNGTIEGFVAMRETMEAELIGHLHFNNSEFGKFLTVHNNKTAEQILNYLNEAYDGSYEAKIIKGDKNARSTQNIPQTALCFSSVSGLIDSGEATEKLKSFLSTGLARRSYLCFPSETESGLPVNESEDWEKRQESRDKEKHNLQEYFNAHTQIVAIGDKKVYASMGRERDYRRDLKQITITPEAYKIFLNYKYECAMQAKEMDNEELKAEVHGRYWKMIKLAGVLSFINGLEITEEIILEAIKISDFYGIQIQSFYEEIDETVSEKVFRFIRNTPKCSKTQIRESKLLGKLKNDTLYINNILAEVQTMCDEKGFFFVLESGRGSTKYYSIKRTPC